MTVIGRIGLISMSETKSLVFENATINTVLRSFYLLRMPHSQLQVYLPTHHWHLSSLRRDTTVLENHRVPKMDASLIRYEQFPARSRATSGQVHGVNTEVSLLEFSDKILLTISQGGRLSQWVGPGRTYSHHFYVLTWYCRSKSPSWEPLRALSTCLCLACPLVFYPRRISRQRLFSAVAAKSVRHWVNSMLLSWLVICH